MDTRRATTPDLEPIRALLEAESLPPLPSDLPLSNVLVAMEDEAPIGAIALEVVVRRGLVQSAVIAPGQRGRGVGASLVRSLISRAHELGLRELYVLTKNASAFFSRLGFLPVKREEVPLEIREYWKQCPEAAAVLRLPLTTRL